MSTRVSSFRYWYSWTENQNLSDCSKVWGRRKKLDNETKDRKEIKKEEEGNINEEELEEPKRPKKRQIEVEKLLCCWMQSQQEDEQKNQAVLAQKEIRKRKLRMTEALKDYATFPNSHYLAVTLLQTCQ